MPRDIIYISSIPWNYFHHRQQEMCECLRHFGYRILFLEPAAKSACHSFSVEKVMPDLHVVHVRGLPYERVLSLVNRLNSAYCNRAITRLIDAYNITRPIIMIDRVHGIGFDFLSELGPTVLDLIDEITAFGRVKNARMLCRLETQALAGCDAVISSSITLGERKCRNLHHDFTFIPNGIQSVPTLAKTDLEQDPGRRIAGFLGTISSRRLDFALLSEVARLLPRWDFRLIGPKAADIHDVGPLPSNITFYEAVSSDDVVRTISEFDVGMIPYNVDRDDMDYVFPKKLLEYLAVGIPIVSTPLKECIRFSDCIRVAGNPRSFADCMVQESEVDSPERRLMRRDIAGAYTWDRLVSQKLLPILKTLEKG